jgi:hypothetical protein
MKTAAPLLLVLLAPASALAHPGHGSEPASSVMHYLGDHGAAVAAAAALLLALGLELRRALRRPSERG